LRAAKRPTGVRLTGRLVVPNGVGLAQGCSGKVRLDLRRGGEVVARGAAQLRRRGGQCVYGRTFKAPAGKGRLTAHARFVGNGTLRPGRAAQARVRGR
jgi:hypothetical protein